MRTEQKPHCSVCGAEGNLLYSGVSDVTFGVPGSWSFRRCPAKHCGLIWLDPAPIESEIGQAYESYYTHHVDAEAQSRFSRLYARCWYKFGDLHTSWRFADMGQNRRPGALLTDLIVGFYPPWRRAMEFPMRLLPPPRTGRILEIGFGQGWLLRQLRRLGWDAEGIEMDQVTIENARRRGLKVRAGSIAAQEYPDDSFDAIVSSHVIEHVHNPQGVMREALRILRPGGRFIAATPNAESLAHRKFGHAWRGLEPPRHLHVFTPASILSLARSAGFMISRTELSIRGARGEWKSSREIQRRLKLPGNTPIHSRACWWGSSGHISAQTKVLVGAAKPEQKTELILIATK